jgi:hypothetical protein
MHTFVWYKGKDYETLNHYKQSSNRFHLVNIVGLYASWTELESTSGDRLIIAAKIFQSFMSFLWVTLGKNFELHRSHLFLNCAVYY